MAGLDIKGIEEMNDSTMEQLWHRTLSWYIRKGSHALIIPAPPAIVFVAYIGFVSATNTNPVLLQIRGNNAKTQWMGGMWEKN